jgi:hypothetical protein
MFTTVGFTFSESPATSNVAGTGDGGSGSVTFRGGRSPRAVDVSFSVADARPGLLGSGAVGDIGLVF